MTSFTKVYALPDFQVAKSEWDLHCISPSQIDEAQVAGKTIAIRLEENDYGVLDYDAHAGTSGLELYEAHKDEYPEFFNNTLTEKTGNGGIHVYFNKTGHINQAALKEQGEADVFDGHSGRWMVIHHSKHKNGSPAAYELLNGAEPQDLPAALLSRLQAYAPTNKSEGSRYLPMPDVKKPHAAEMTLVTFDANVWGESGTDRNYRLFCLVIRAFGRFVGDSDERMGKALWLAEEVLNLIPSSDSKYRSLQDWWNFNKGLSAALDSAKKEDGDSDLLSRPKGLPEFETTEWQPGGVLLKGRITGLVAPTKVGKTTFAMGHLVSDAAKEGMRLIVISEETTAKAVWGYAYAHGYEHATIDHYSSEVPQGEHWEARHKFVMGMDGLFDSLRNALQLDGGKPAVLVVENPETLMGRADDVTWIGGEIGGNLQPASYKNFVSKVETELLKPGGHSMVWVTHTTRNDKEGSPRGGAAGIERFRSLYQLHGSIDETVEVYVRSNVYNGPRKLFVVVRPVSQKERMDAAKRLGVSTEDAELPYVVLSDLLADAVEEEEDNFSVDGIEFNKPMTASKALEMVNIEGNAKDPGRSLRALTARLATNRIKLVKSGSRSYTFKSLNDDTEEAPKIAMVDWIETGE